MKSELDPVSVPVAVYSDSEFFMVHPYFDETEDHIRFVDGDVSYPIVIEAMTDKGV